MINLFLRLLIKNILNIFSSLNLVSYYLTPYTIFFIVFLFDGVDYIIVTTTWIITTLFYSFLFTMIIKKRDIRTGHSFLYLESKKLTFSYYIFDIIISIPFYIVISLYFIGLSLILFFISLPLSYTIIAYTLKIKNSIIFKLNESVISISLITLSLTIVILFDCFYKLLF